jgi:hypothetical protein
MTANLEIFNSSFMLTDISSISSLDIPNPSAISLNTRHNVVTVLRDTKICILIHITYY